MTILRPAPICYRFEQDGRKKKGGYKKGFAVDYHQERSMTLWYAHRLPVRMREESRWSALDERLPLGVHAMALGDELAALKLSDLVQEIGGPEWVWKLLADDPDWWKDVERLLMRSDQEEERQRRERESEQLRVSRKVPAHLPHAGNPFVGHPFVA